MFQLKNTYVTGNRVHLFPFYRFNPIYGKVNIAFVNDIRSKQYSLMGCKKESSQYLSLDKSRFRSLSAMITLNQPFAEDIFRWYGKEESEIDWFQFLSYPSKIETVSPKRREIVFIDNSSVLFQDEFYNKLIHFLDTVGYEFNIPTKLVCSNIEFADKLNKRYKTNRTKCLSIYDYDYRSEYGILVDVANYGYLTLCLPRKLMIYLHCGMKVLVQYVFTESIKFMKDNGVTPLIFDEIHTIEGLDKGARKYNRHKFSMDNQINRLIDFLNDVENSRKYESKIYYP